MKVDRANWWQFGGVGGGAMEGITWLHAQDVWLGLHTVAYTAYGHVLTPVIQYETKPDLYHKPKSQTVDGMVRP